MHRQRTQFARRVNRVFTHRADRVAKAVERRGIRATYELHDRVLSNRKSRALYEGDRPELDDVQRRILADVEANGFAVASFGELFQDEGHWHELEAMRDRFVAETEADLAKGGEQVRVRAGKEFVVRLHSYGAQLGLDDPWFRAVASRRLLDLANTYLEMWSKLEYVDVWYSVPQPAEAERISSQRWHRDYNDKHLLKVFLYLVDVDEDDGPVPVRARESARRAVRRRLAVGAARAELPDGGGARGAHPELVDPRVHRAEGDAHLLQHRRLPPWRLLDDEPARARDGDVLLARLARVADGAELRARRLARRTRRADALRGHLIKRERTESTRNG